MRTILTSEILPQDWQDAGYHLFFGDYDGGGFFLELIHARQGERVAVIIDGPEKSELNVIQAAWFIREQDDETRATVVWLLEGVYRTLVREQSA